MRLFNPADVSAVSADGVPRWLHPHHGHGLFRAGLVMEKIKRESSVLACFITRKEAATAMQTGGSGGAEVQRAPLLSGA